MVSRFVVLGVIERCLVTARHVLVRSLDHAQMRVHAWRVSYDPTLPAWVASTDVMIADGTFRQRLETQPDPLEIFENWRATR